MHGCSRPACILGAEPFSLCPVQRGQIPNIKRLYPNRKSVYTPYSRSPRWNVLLPASAVIKGQRLLPQPSRSRRLTHPVQPIPHLLEFQWRCQAGERAPGLCCSQLANPALHLGAQYVSFPKGWNSVLVLSLIKSYDRVSDRSYFRWMAQQQQSATCRHGSLSAGQKATSHLHIVD